MTLDVAPLIQTDAPIDTWFGVGGRADTLARPATTEQLRDLLLMFADQPVRILGDGANLLVHDEGVEGLVISLDRLASIEAHNDPEDDPDGEVIVHAQAGAKLPKLILETTRAGVAGLESLGGIPASIGGAVVMNAGGAFGEIAPLIHRVHAMTRFGQPITIPAPQVAFDYRHSGLDHLVITAVDFRLRRVPAGAEPHLRERLKEVMAYKKKSQPLRERSGGCAFRNPLVGAERVSAGKLIDQAGCKGLRVGGASVSDVHANFLVCDPSGSAEDVIRLIDQVRERVRAHHAVELEPEVVVWRRGGTHTL